MHSLNNVAAIVKHSANVLRIDSAREVWIAKVLAVARLRADTLLRGHPQNK